MNRADFSTDITKLSSEERRILAKDLWRMHHPDEPVDEEEFKRDLERLVDEADAHPENMISWNDLSRELDRM